MNRIGSLVALLQQAESTRDSTRVDVLRAETHAQAARAQLDQLIAYRSDKEQRYAREFSVASSIELLHTYQAFMQRLGAAIEQQERVVRHCEARLESLNDTLRRHELQVASIRKLLERRAEETRRSGAQREQRVSDELAARAAFVRPSLVSAHGA